MVSPTTGRRISYDAQYPMPFVPVLRVSSCAVPDDYCTVAIRVNFLHHHSLAHLVSSVLPVLVEDSYIRIHPVDGAKEEEVVVVVMVYDRDCGSNDTMAVIGVDTGGGDDVAAAVAVITLQKFCSYHQIHHHNSNSHCSSCSDGESIAAVDTEDVMVESRSVQNVIAEGVLWC